MSKHINRFKEIHGTKYDYSNVIYTNQETKIKIKCNKHNYIFQQTPRTHIANKSEGCIHCFKEKIVDKFNFIHNNKYDYSLVEYKSNSSKIKIICPKHGIFEQMYRSHGRGRGCPQCSTRDINEVLQQCNFIHNGKYDYSLVEYNNMGTKVKIICPKHKIFEQALDTHIKGHGCPLCSIHTTESIIHKFNSIHGNKYNYSLVEYTNSKNKVKIICPKHGIFEQTPSNHAYSKEGCPTCFIKLTSEEIYKNKPTILYYIKINDIHFKVGVTTKSVMYRYNKELKKGINIKVLREIRFEDGLEAVKLENKILKQSINKAKIEKIESFILGGHTEIRCNDFIDIFDNTINLYKENNEKEPNKY